MNTPKYLGYPEHNSSPAKLRQRLYSDVDLVANDFSEMPVIDLDVYL